MDLFEKAAEDDVASRAPLAERMRPKTLEEYLGQQHLTGAGKLLRKAIEQDMVPSMIFWGPPGTGKTTLAKIVAHATGAHFEAISAVLAGVKDIREAIAAADTRWKMNRKRTILFVDEIHRFNKSQQDALLPHVEKGTITLLGATTENPSFEVNAALLSRMRVVTLKALEEADVRTLLDRAIADPLGLNGATPIDDEAKAYLAMMSGGDARKALTTLEVAAKFSPGGITRASVEEALQQRTLLFDKSGEEHFNVVSAFIKSMRTSDADAAVYWLARLIEAGEDPRFIVRRMVIFASEDVGNADPQALQVAVAALHSVELIGFPEGTLPLTQAVTYLALAPKSNAALTAYATARELVNTHGALGVPLHLRNAPTSLMKSLGYGSGYKYPHDAKNAVVDQPCLPEGLRGQRIYEPSERGVEAQLKARQEALRAQRLPAEPGEDG